MALRSSFADTITHSLDLDAMRRRRALAALSPARPRSSNSSRPLRVAGVPPAARWLLRRRPPRCAARAGYIYISVNRY